MNLEDIYDLETHLEDAFGEQLRSVLSPLGVPVHFYHSEEEMLLPRVELLLKVGTEIGAEGITQYGPQKNPSNPVAFEYGMSIVYAYKGIQDKRVRRAIRSCLLPTYPTRITNPVIDILRIDHADTNRSFDNEADQNVFEFVYEGVFAIKPSVINQ